MTSCHAARALRGGRTSWNGGPYGESSRSSDGWFWSFDDARWSRGRPRRHSDGLEPATALAGTVVEPKESTACPAAVRGGPRSAARGLTSQGSRATRLSKCRGGGAVRSWPKHNCTCCRNHDKMRGFRRSGCTFWLVQNARPRSVLKMVRAERQQQDDRDRNTDQPKQDGAHDFRLLLTRSGINNSWREERFRYDCSRTGPVAGSALCWRRPSIAARNMIAAA